MGERSQVTGTKVNTVLTIELGHVWPSTEINFSALAAKKGPTHIEASAIVMKFFDQWTRYGSM